jgi:glycosyltransferase involved in cell wall biosynthesis
MDNAKTEKAYNVLYTTAFSNMAGGGQWSLYYLIKHLNKKVYHPVVLCPDEGELAQNMRNIGADVIFLNIGRIRHLNLNTIRRLSYIIKNKNISLIHTDSTTETFYAGLAARVIGIPLIWHIRVSDGELLLDRLLSALSTKLILVANALRTRFKWLDEEKARTIYNGIDLEEFDSLTAPPSIRDKFNIEKDKVLLLCSGRIEERKGQEYLISAMMHVNNAKLILAGRADETYLKRIKKMCDQLKVSDRVVFTGHRNDIPALLREIDIFVFPVISGEGFSRAILEAMAAGKPVIATDDAGNPEAVIDGATGYIVRTKDTAILTDKINELILNKEKRGSMGMAGRKRVEKMFPIERYIRGIEKLYNEILSS